MTRSFTVEAVYNSGKRLDYKGGRFESNNFYDAVKKAYSKIYRHYKKQSKRMNSFVIHLKETTKNSTQSVKKYRVKKILYDEGEKHVVCTGKTIAFTFRTVVTAL